MRPEEMLGERLCDLGLTIAVAESCTGGLVTDRITDVPGSSHYLLVGVIAYSNEHKMRLLNVSRASLIAHGAVSEEVAREMAEGIKQVSGADIGVSTTGIAGPGGGSEEKPVGLVHMGFAGPWGSTTRREVFQGDRREVKQAATEYVLMTTISLLDRAPSDRD